MSTLTHPDEAEAMARADEGERAPRFWCEGCQAASAYYIRKTHTWHPSRVECGGCGWWQPWAEYEAITRETLGLDGGQAALALARGVAP